MLTTMMLSALLMLWGLGAFDLQVYGKSIHSDKTLLISNDGKHSARKQPHQQIKGEIRRSLDLESYNIHVSPTTSKHSLPTIIRIYPPTSIPRHLHANIPMRFGRDSDPRDGRAPSSPNKPQRFGRSSKLIQMCADCPDVREAPNPVLPQRFGRNSPYWSFLRSLASQRLLNAGLHW
ncbi:pro-FMRFamide-related neuropeptide VF [Stegastes partitus]|nr:PREDICTED: pro-FMRFamide-related neuropeptide VF-like [Stegastes partitus]